MVQDLKMPVPGKGARECSQKREAVNVLPGTDERALYDAKQNYRPEI
jgi:hypothetical protein